MAFKRNVHEAITQAANEYGLDPTLLATFAQIESSGNPNAKTGSYRGLFQMSKSEFNKYGGGDIYDPFDNSRRAAAKLKDESAAYEKKYGRPPSATDLYMIHQQGQGGYDAHVRNPDAPAWENMYSTGEGRSKGPGWAKRAIWGNVPADVRDRFGSVDDITSKDFLGLWDEKVQRIGGKSVPNSPGQMMARAIKERFQVGKEDPSDIGGEMAMAQAQPTLTGGEQQDSLKSLPGYDKDRLARADKLSSQWGETAKNANNWGDVINALVQSGAGAYMRSEEGGKKKASDDALRSGLQDSGGDPKRIGQLFLSSQDPSVQLKGAEILQKVNAPKEMLKVAAGETIYDPNTGKPVFTGQAKEEARTPDMKEYDFAMQERQRAGSATMPFEQWKKETKSSGVTINNAGEKAGSVEMGKLFAKRYDNIQSAADNAQETLANTDQLKAGLEMGTRTGALGEFEGTVRSYAQLLGVGNVEKLAGAELINATRNKMSLLMRSPDSGMGMPGALSDRDLKFLKDAQPGLERSPVGNSVMIDAIERMAQRKLDTARLADEYVAKNGQLDAGFNTQLRTFAAENPLFEEGWGQMKGPEAPTALPPAVDPASGMPEQGEMGAIARPASKVEYDALDRGTLFIDPNGMTRRKP